MKMYLLFFIAFLTFSSSLQAQLSNRSTIWYPGIIILNNNEIIKGDISYNYAYDIVMCKEGELTKTFTTHQVSSFKYFDEEDNLFHEYITLSNEVTSEYQKKAFYEVVLEGDINYVRKRNRFPAYHAKEGYLATRNAHMNKHKVCYEYFVHYDNDLIKSRRFKQEVLPIMESKEYSISAYMREKQLKTYNIGDQIELVEYYNSVSNLNNRTAIQRTEKPAQYTMVVD
ncbi:hypothetical protein [Catalinimonas niigatensis]|uniref:hypothetical protein n=1 Tax=Catalinimonas niigatensis TaxID=1397264 RepID=UPI0026663AFF|nr:hypothetical protein [Catalinimonas niigatensis]WPP49500.1 hypothetical protein PZB72_22780 [Catalinimonas niigatensis]